jgi:hypothetical protein
MEADFKARLASLRGMSEVERKDMKARLSARLPCKLRPWPFGMPTSADPVVVVIGASPGNSPAASGQPTSASGVGAYDPPTFGQVHGGFYYEDTKHYWSKVRSLCVAVGRSLDPDASPEDSLALAGHFNLGTGLAGAATLGVVEPGIVSWISGLLGSVLNAQVVICFGINSVLTSPEVSELWNDAPGSLHVNWASPQRLVPFDKYSFRLWDAMCAEGERVLVCTWPNHPSRHPFAGPPDSAQWLSAVREYCDIVRARAGLEPTV